MSLLSTLRRAFARYPRKATWTNKDFSKPVTVIGEFGEHGGEFYYKVQDGSGVTGIPKSQLKFK